ncbi:putative bifunctional diguanylate cyclase/phosphodiesterase [Luteimonas kalidii]|uniref:EAL domain-containing protein n=1 Tax=Luteimonas kalidii TaxID=3042025 RepID=A0ABT6JTJ5_9GAMM|nr:EAL domain-containing protein [Luteimonas kalidii]MDH5833271.1 EAL domain-containing protein [Luteimonas kalidii]
MPERQSPPRSASPAELQPDRIWIRNLLDASDEAIYFKDLDSRFLRVSLGLANLHGLTQAHMCGMTDADLFADAHAAEALADEQAILRTGVAILDKEECEDFDDRPVRWVSTSKFPLRDLDGTIIGTFGVSHDITRRVLAEQEMVRLAEASAEASARLAQVEAQLRSVLNGSADAIAQYAPDLTYRYMNPAGERLRGRSLDQLVGRTDREVGPAHEAADSWEAALRQVLETGRQGEHEFCMALPGGKRGWFHTTLSPETEGSGAVVGVLTSTRDVTANKEAELALAHQAMHDPVTGVANRYLLMDRLDQALLRLERMRGQVMLTFIDLDHFKSVNDTYGHDVGDEVLVELAQRLSVLTRREDTVARLGGDEFVVLCEHVTRDEDVRAVAAILVEAMAEPFCVGDGLQVRLSASIGVAVTSDASMRACDLLRNADSAMYRIKQQGRNGFHVFDPAADAGTSGAVQLEADLQHALGRDEFALVYQPLLSLADQRVIGFEALLRWRHPARGTLAPAEFLCAAERMGLMGRIGDWVLDTACSRLAAWSSGSGQRAGAQPLSMAVNISGSQLRAPGFADRVRAALAAHAVAPASLRLEISERELIHDDPRVTGALAELGEVGVQLVVDDFGASVTSLSRLPRIPVSVVKLARFADLHQRGIVAAVIATAHGLDMSVVGGGIEDAAQLAELKAMACDDGQGFLLGRPLDESAAEALLHGGRGAGAIGAAGVTLTA